jgi:hypothetical protein
MGGKLLPKKKKKQTWQKILYLQENVILQIRWAVNLFKRKIRLLDLIFFSYTSYDYRSENLK